MIPDREHTTDAQDVKVLLVGRNMLVGKSDAAPDSIGGAQGVTDRLLDQ